MTSSSGKCWGEVARLCQEIPGANVDYPWPEIETLNHQLQVLSQYSWQRWQKLVASVEMGLAAALQTVRQEWIDVLAGRDPQEIQSFLTKRLPQFSPSQWEVIIATLPTARDRALASRYVSQTATTAELQAMATRAYALSGLPLLLDAEGSLDRSTSSEVVKAILTTQISSASLTWVVAFLGGKTLRQLGWDRDPFLSQDPDSQSSPLPDQDTGDPWLGFTQAGVQVSQLSEFVALRIQALLNTGIGRIPPLLPYQPMVEIVRWLTSDPLLGISHVAEFSLVAASQERRLELLCERLQSQNRLPTPLQCEAGIPEVVAHVDPELRTIVGKQLILLATALDPQERSDWINQLGRQLNLYNPLQYLEGWNGQAWLGQLLERIENLQVSYPECSLWQDYTAGIRRAQELSRVMDQAEVLRQTAWTLAPHLKES